MPDIDRLYCDTNILIHLGEDAELSVRPYRQKQESLIRLYENWLVGGDPWLLRPEPSVPKSINETRPTA